jgi:SWI/SNF-related matrix-associated actin-dependent regulator of chromatin subfamily A member 5
MLDRIRRKLFLSLKVMSADSSASTNGSNLGSTELLDILRKGSGALSDADDGMGLAQFLDADIEEILSESRSRESIREAKLKHELCDELDNEDDQPDEHLLKDAEEEEARLLSGIAQVKCRLFEGKVVNRVRDNKDIAKEWQNLQGPAKADPAPAASTIVRAHRTCLPQESDIMRRIPGLAAAKEEKAHVRVGRLVHSLWRRGYSESLHLLPSG